MPRTTLDRLRLVGNLEGISFLLLLFVAMPLKYVAHLPIAVRVTGPIHGFFFVAFVYLVFAAASEHDWPIKKSILALAASLVPFGPFLLDRKLAAEANATAATGGETPTV